MRTRSVRQFGLRSLLVIIAGFACTIAALRQATHGIYPEWLICYSSAFLVLGLTSGWLVGQVVGRSRALVLLWFVLACLLAGAVLVYPFFMFSLG